MLQQVVIVFLGIVIIAQTQGGSSRRAILPNAGGTHAGAHHPIPRHRGFVMFPASALVSSQEWAAGGEVVIDEQPRSYFLLDGDELSIRQAAGKLQTEVLDANGYSLTKHCRSFELADAFLTGRDPALKTAHIDLSSGVLRVRKMFDGMQATEWSLDGSGAGVTITARSFSSGKKRSVTVKPGTEIWIGNLPESFFDAAKAGADDDAHPHFLAYYAMSKRPNKCSWVPGRKPADRVREPEEEKNLGVTCSNSTYP